jgi:hypothetical protein
MTSAPSGRPAWRKSSRSSGQDTCVELVGTLDAVRDSKNLDGPVLHVDLAVFVAAVKAGEIRA